MTRLRFDVSTTRRIRCTIVQMTTPCPERRELETPSAASESMWSDLQLAWLLGRLGPGALSCDFIACETVSLQPGAEAPLPLEFESPDWTPPSEEDERRLPDDDPWGAV